jgi:hypothetical protein
MEEEGGCASNVFVTLALVVGVWSASLSGRFTLREGVLSRHKGRLSDYAKARLSKINSCRW